MWSARDERRSSDHIRRRGPVPRRKSVEDCAQEIEKTRRHHGGGGGRLAKSTYCERDNRYIVVFRAFRTVWCVL